MWLSMSEGPCESPRLLEQALMPDTEHFQREFQKDLSHKLKFEK